MKYLFLLSLGFIFAINTYAKFQTPEYSNAEIQSIAMDNIKTQVILAQAGLEVDLENSTIKLKDANKFMAKCNVVIFSDSELEALSMGAPAQDEPQPKAKQQQQDIRQKTNDDINQKSKDFWNNVIY